MRLLNRLKLAISTSDEWDVMFVAFLSFLYIFALGQTWVYYHPEPIQLHHEIKIDTSVPKSSPKLNSTPLLSI